MALQDDLAGWSAVDTAILAAQREVARLRGLQVVPGSPASFLVASYLRLVVGLRAALVEAGPAQVVFLVLFSYAFFFEGYTGLTVTVDAVLTLFALMQITGWVDWERVFRSPGGATAEPASR